MRARPIWVRVGLLSMTHLRGAGEVLDRIQRVCGWEEAGGGCHGGGVARDHGRGLHLFTLELNSINSSTLS